MQQIPNPMANLYQFQLEVSRRFAEAIFAGTKKLDHLVLEATHHAVDQQLRMAQALTSGGSPAESGLALSLTRSSGEAINYQTEFMRAIAELQTEIGRSMYAYMDQIGTQPAKATVMMAEPPSAPEPATEATLNPMTSMLSMWEAAFKEANAMATRNLSAARSSVQQASESAASQARASVRAAHYVAESGGEGARRGSGNGIDGSASRRR